MISYDVTATIFIYQNNQMAAVLVGFKFLTCADTLLCTKLFNSIYLITARFLDFLNLYIPLDDN